MSDQPTEEIRDKDGKLLQVRLNFPDDGAAQAMVWGVNTSAGISDKQETVLVGTPDATHLCKKVTRGGDPGAVEYHRYAFKGCEITSTTEVEATSFIDVRSKVSEPSCPNCQHLLYREHALNERERAFLRMLILEVRKQRPDDELSVVAIETAAAFAYPILTSDVERAVEMLEDYLE